MSLLLVTRLLAAAAVFVVSAVAELADRAGSGTALALSGSSAVVVGPVTAAVLEPMAAGLLHPAGPGVTTGTALVVTLLGVSTAAVLTVLARGQEVNRVLDVLHAEFPDAPAELGDHVQAMVPDLVVAGYMMPNLDARQGVS